MTKQPKTNQANPMWGGQYSTGPADVMAKINVSIGFDKALYAADIAGSAAHATMLAETGIISGADAAKIIDGLQQIQQEIEGGTFEFREALEDIHMNIEARLAELIGEAAGRLHTARSRNDQVATSFRLHVRDAIGMVDAALLALQKVLLARAEEFAATVMPGFTHLQAAQPVTLGHHLLAYVEMFGRDRARFADCRSRLNECPLGAAALAGTSFPIRRERTAELLGFARPMANSLDAVASRDYALEFLSTTAICSVHLSRLAEEFVLWSGPLGFIRFSDAFSTGSSIMPQKRNPDAAELVRGKSGRLFGNLQALLVTLKGLPLAYNKDMQEDKEPVFDSIGNLLLCLHATTGMVGDFHPDMHALREAAGEGYTTATDLADWLVRELKMPFRLAHHAAARIVKLATEKGIALEKLSLADMQSVEPKITDKVFAVLGVDNSVNSRASFGGTAPGNVRAQVKAWKEQL